MSDELIRKSELLEKLNDLYEPNWTNDDYDDYVTGFNLGLGVAIGAIEDMPPVNAVEVPCKVGDTIYVLCKLCNAIHEYEVVGFRYEYEMVFIECKLNEYTDKDIGVRVFLTREEAEKALEDLKNG